MQKNKKAEDYGGYYAWGGNQDMKDDHYAGEGPLSGDNDTATNLWGNNWRMPTKAEFQGLIDNCVFEWTTVNSVNGCKFTGKGAYASNSIFLPAAGLCYGDQGYDNPYDQVYDQGKYGDYWSSTPCNSLDAYGLYFNSGYPLVGESRRYCGYSVRAVLAE